jgi:DNA-binding transcriptional regulator PaaX
MSAADDILSILFSYSDGYARLRRSARGNTRPSRMYYYSMPSTPSQPRAHSSKKVLKDSTLRSTLSRLKKQGLAVRENDTWVITSQGRTYYEQLLEKQERAQLRARHRKKEKNMIVAFDVPEHQRATRDWLRDELIDLGFELVQKSVWFGPGPLPEAFIRMLDKKGALSCIKFFRAREKEIV